MISSLGGRIVDGVFTTLYGEPEKIKYDEVLSFCLRKDLLDEMESDRVYDFNLLGKMFVVRAVHKPVNTLKTY